ncbi:MAG TPA: hypothetical protein VHL52_11730, partial [Acidimicrobiia bacterium]|nr:hypothetical protein [Acidimicrobiia bacterium]
MRARPAAVALLTGILLGLASVAMALTESVADDFSSGGYSGSTGTADWASNWSEIGESDGAGAGSVRVKADSDCATGKCLVIEKLVGGLQNLGAGRTVSLAGATSATLSYDVVFPGGLLVDGVIQVKASVDGGGWISLRSHEGGTADRFAVALPLGDEVTISFVASNLSLATSAAIDDIEIEVKRPDPTTTTTSTTTTATTTTTIKTTTSTTAATTTSTSAPTTTTTATTVLRQTEPSPTTSTTTA